MDQGFKAEQGLRWKKIATYGGILLSVGFAYYLFVRWTGMGIPCLIRLVTGVYCPGCGITRMFVSLFSGDIVGAVRYNLLLMILLPFALFFGIRRVILYVRSGKSESDRAEMIFLVIVFVLTVAFWILRNTEPFAWMRPGSL